jgi:hypothetical protein
MFQKGPSSHTNYGLCRPFGFSNPTSSKVVAAILDYNAGGQLSDKKLCATVGKLGMEGNLQASFDPH